MKKITDRQILKLISALVESNEGFESDSVMFDIAQKRKVGERELILATLVGQIYRIIHPRFADCPHSGWEQETKKLIKKLNIK